MTTAAVDVRRSNRLDPREIAEVLALTHAAGDADGAYPLSEHVVLHIRRGGDSRAVHLMIRAGDELVGYAHVDTTDPVEGASAELCVHPLFRRQGLGRALVVEAMAVVDEKAGGTGRLRLWAHGDHPSAAALALSLGFERWRVLWQMRRSLYAPVPVPVLPDGVRIREFRPGADDEAWVAVNAAAFADLPDQGSWTIDDLRVRESEPWFDPAGFLLAERESDGELLGFHWTKVHGEVRTDEAPAGQGVHAHDPIGEVYVLGVAPAAHGTGLGTALTLAGLRYLRARGLDQAMLYVDEANPRAIGLYRKMGFARWSTDVCFLRR